MASIQLKADARFDKYGVVSVRNADKSINREYRITGEELGAFKALPNGVPPGVTEAERQSCLVFVHGKGLDVGDVYVNKAGWLKMNVSERTVAGRIVWQYIVLEPGEWTGTIPNITMSAEKISSIEGQPLLSVIDGVVEVK